ncbi:RpiB/LacA/LacB family sugar-phosphate isomerase [Gaoshiqia sp. Z1-71]|uniref:RpiB/LacA/LacB family sugar-phosphate isomerase n=1 Tax=Gaoshiqia hydrogeniformans TaxID=3290090 RepID=UPI003BF8BDB6
MGVKDYRKAKRRLGRKRKLTVGIAANHSGFIVKTRFIAELKATTNKVAGVRNALITENFSAKHGVENIYMNLMCLDQQVNSTDEQCWTLVQTFLNANFKEEGKLGPRLSKLFDLEQFAET